MVSRAAVEVLKKAEDLKEKASSLKQVDLNLESMTTPQQQLQKIYHDVLILDLEYALDKKVEQDLWNFCFKNYIACLQSHAKDKKNNGLQLQSRLSWFLDCASGFYLSLLQEICTVFNLDLPFMRHDSSVKPLEENNRVINRPQRSSCYYFCQYCIVHLGDIARYKNQTTQAESFYRHAVSLGANSGHPYNQLALLEATRSDWLSTVFYYTRSIAVTHKFPAAASNLEHTLMKCSNFEPPKEGSKMSAAEYESSFLKLHAYIYLNQDVQKAQTTLQTLTHALTPLVATQEFSSWKLVQMTVISIFIHNQVECAVDKTSASPLRVASDHDDASNLNLCFQVLSEFLTSYLNSLLVPLYTISSEAALLDYFGLPAIKVVLSWFRCDPRIVASLNRQHLWRGICKLLNSLKSFNLKFGPKYMNLALPEDYDLQGFLPLDSALNCLDYGNDRLSDDEVLRLRASRLLEYGEWLAGQCEHKPIYIDESGQFDIAQVEASCFKLPVSMPDTALVGLTPSFIPENHTIRNRQQQNVALQSLMKKSLMKNEQPELEPKTEWTNSVMNSRGVDWWPHGSRDEFLSPWPVASSSETSSNSLSQEGTYSLFSANGESQLPSTNGLLTSSSNSVNQSFWLGPGPSPLERLLEQQKQLRKQHDT